MPNNYSYKFGNRHAGKMHHYPEERDCHHYNPYIYPPMMPCPGDHHHHHPRPGYPGISPFFPLIKPL